MDSSPLIIFCILFFGCPNWLNAQDSVSSKAFELEAIYSALPWYNLEGGIESDFVYMDNLDLSAKINFHRIFNLEEQLSLYVYALRNNGAQATDLMGDFQVASNIESVRSWRLFELFVQQNFYKNRISVLAGLYDLNSEFDVLRPGTLFINSSFGIGAEYAQAGKNGPSIFPISSLGIRMATLIGDRIRMKVCILDGVPGDPDNLKSNEIHLSKEDGALLASEFSIYTDRNFTRERNIIERNYETRRRKVGRDFEASRNDKINIGFWYFTSDFREINDSLSKENTNMGAYIGMQKYIRINQKNDHLSLFLRFGLANSHFNFFGTSLSGGIVLGNPFFKMRDSFGLGFSSGYKGNKHPLSKGDFNNAETALEFTYSLPLTSWFLLQPDIQYIINPSLRNDISNPLSLAILMQITVGN